MLAAFSSPVRMTPLRRLLLCLALLPTTALAATVQTEADAFLFEQKNDQYRFGDVVTLPAPFPGDVLAAGQTVTIDERVDDDLNAAGTTVIVNTTVGGNLRAVGQTVIIRGIVEGSVFVAGGTLTLQEGARIQGDLTALGATVRLDGTVAGNAFVRGERISLGAVNGNVDVRGETVTLGGTVNGDAVLVGAIRPGENARINGNVRYWSPDGDTLGTTVSRAPAQFDAALAVEAPRDDGPAGAAFVAVLMGAVSVFALLSAATVLLVLMPLMPRLPTDAAKTLQKSPWRSLGWGALFFLGLPLAAVFLAITVVGLPLALVALLKFVIGLLLARVLAALVLVRWLEHRRKASWNPWFVGLLAVVGYAVLHVVAVIPVVGWLASTALILLGFGAWVVTAWEKARKIF